MTTPINQLIQEHQPYLIQRAKCIATNSEEAQELVQDAIVRLIEQADKYDATRNFKAWSFQVMRNLYINQYNRRKRYRVYATESKDLVPILKKSQNQGEGNLYLEFLNQSIDELKKPHKKAFQLFFEGYEQKEIAARFKIPVGTVKYHIFMAKKQLQQIVNNDFACQ